MINTGQSQEVGSEIFQDSALATDTSLYSRPVDEIPQAGMNRTDSHTGSIDGEQGSVDSDGKLTRKCL